MNSEFGKLSEDKIILILFLFQRAISYDSVPEPRRAGAQGIDRSNTVCIY